MADLIDRVAILKFVVLLHARAAHALNGERGVLQLCTLVPTDRRMCTQAFNVGDTQAMVEAATVGAQAGYNVFVEARAVKPGHPNERGKVYATTGVFAFVIDHDADKNRAGHINGNASAVVETSPGNHHEWLFLDRALNADAATPIGAMIRATSGADACTGVITQPYRLPGTVNYPDQRKVARGRAVTPTRLISVSEKVWTPDELIAAFGQTPSQEPRATKPRKKANTLNDGANTPRKHTVVELKVSRKVTPETDRSAEFQSAVAAAVHTGMTPDELEALMRKHPHGCASKYLEHGDRLRQEIERSYTKAEQPTEPATPSRPAAPQHPPRTLADVHGVFRKWFGSEFDTDTIDAVMATAAAERLLGDPLWLLLISGPGNTKTETVQSLLGAGAHITSTIASEGALLSASPRSSQVKNATGGLLRKLGQRGILVIKDVTSILSADRNTRAGVLAALREVFDGRWERNVGTDGGQTLTWTGRIAVVGAVTTAWDTAAAVISVMGDRFVLIRSDSRVGRDKAGRQAIRNTGTEATMRTEIAAAVGGLIGTIDSDQTWPLTDDEIDRLIKAADIVTYARTAVERDYRGDVIDSHAPEMPTRFAKQLAQLVRGGSALSMDRERALLLALRCARDSIPQLRLEILLDLAANPRSRAIDVCRNITKPLRTVRRELEALHMLGLLRCDEEQSVVDENKTIWRYSLAEAFDRTTLLTMGRLRTHNPGRKSE